MEAKRNIDSGIGKLFGTLNDAEGLSSTSGAITKRNRELIIGKMAGVCK